MSQKKKFVKKDAFEEYTKSVIENIQNLAEGERPAWVRPWSVIDSVFRNYQHNKPYRGLHNNIACMIGNWEDPRFLTFNQVRKLGGNVKKGSKGTRLIAWNFIEKTDPETGEKRTIPFAKNITVFNIEQTEGLDVKELPKAEDTGVRADTVIEGIFKSLNVEWKEGGNSACYIPAFHRIEMPPASRFNDQNEHSATMLHELVHWTSKPLERKMDDYAFEELVAELGAMRLCQILGIDGFMDDNHLTYVAGWAKEMVKDSKYLYRAAKLAEKAVDYIAEESNLAEVLGIEDEEPADTANLEVA